MEKKFFKRGALRFKRFCRAGYAVFRSLHREVTIGQLASYIADRQLGKVGATVAVCTALLFAPATIAAQTDDDPSVQRNLPLLEVMVATDSLQASAEPVVLLTADDLKHTSIQSIADLVALLPGVDLRTRGPYDVQADLSMHGGTFDQMVVLLGGINLTDAQTGHHTMDIPIDITMVSRVELLSPAQLLSRGIVSFCGGVNIVVCDEYRDRLAADLSAASHGTAHASLLATKQLGQWSLTTAAAYNRSDGYRLGTDFRFGNLLLQALRHTETDEWQLTVGGQIKDFGGQAFYSTTYPDQYEATRTLTLSAGQTHRFEKVALQTTAYTRMHTDRFELFRHGRTTPPAWYTDHNHHLGEVAGLRSRLVGQHGCIGAELRQEGIASNVLGDSLNDKFLRRYPLGTSRLNASLFADYTMTVREWQARANALGAWNSSFGFDYAAAASVTRHWRRWQVGASISRTYRIPTFTDLYYKSVNQQADPNLHPEHNIDLRLEGQYESRLTRLSLTVYHRHGNDIIDWVRSPEQELWRATNHTAVDATGLDVAAVVRPTTRLTIGASYAFCHVAQDAGDLISGSALDYLRHVGTMYASYNPIQRLTLKMDASFRSREGNYVEDGEVRPYGNVLLIGASAEYAITANITLRLFADNLTNATWRDHGGIPMPGRTVGIGLRYAPY